MVVVAGLKEVTPEELLNFVSFGPGFLGLKTGWCYYY